MKRSRFVSLLLCLLLVLSMAAPPAFAQNAGYSDVSESDWFYEGVSYVTENNLLEGTSSTRFSPHEVMTSGAVIDVLYRAAGEPDVTVQSAASNAASWAINTGIVSGVSFVPEAPVARAQMVQMLYLYTTEYLGVGAVNTGSLSGFTDASELSLSTEYAMAWAYGNKLVRGTSGTTLSPRDSVDRAQASVMIARLMTLLDSTNAAPRTRHRIVCMAPSMVEVVYSLGCGKDIVGWSAYTDYPVAATETRGYDPYGYYYDTDTQDFDLAHEMGKEVAVVSKFFDYNPTILAAVEPTLILCEGTEQAPWVEELNAAGYDNVHCYAPESIDEIYDMMLEVGELLGCKERAQQLVDGYYKRIDEIRAISSKLPDIPTYFEIAHQSDYGEYGIFGPYTEGGNTPFDEMIEIAGGANLFSDQVGYVDLYEEFGAEAFAEIVKRNPRVILSPYWPNAYDFEVTTIYEIMTRPGFSETDAVKDGRVAYYDSSLMKRFGPRTITAIEKLAYLLHPYYFENPENSVSPWELGKIDVAEKPPRALD